MRPIVRPLGKYPNSAIVESLRASCLTRLDHLRPSVRVSERVNDLIPTAGECRIVITPDVTPISDCIRKLPPIQSVFAHCFDVGGAELEELHALRKRGRIGKLSYRMDQKAYECLPDSVFDWWPATPDRVELCQTHAKQWVIRHRDGVQVMLSSSNDGNLSGRLEWWATCSDAALADELDLTATDREPVAHTHRGREPVKGFNRAMDLLGGCLPSLAFLRTAPDVPSGGLLAALLHLAGGGAQLNLMSMSTSMRFLQSLHALRTSGQIDALNWSIDHSILQRLGGQTGHTDIRPHLERYAAGCYTLPRERIHAKWATIRGKTGSVAVLTSANWQASNPREEQYLITTDQAVIDKLDQVQLAINAGRVVR